MRKYGYTTTFILLHSITYSLHEKFTKAQIIVYDSFGKILKQVAVSGIGKRTLKIDAGTLSSGTNNYSLIVDGETMAPGN